LIDARTDEHIWADTFDRELSAANVFAIQSEIATAIADALEARLSDEEEARVAAVLTEDLAALEAYFAGRRLINERTTESLHESIGQFERAVAIDPAFAAAWAGIAEAWLELPNYDAGVNLQKSRREASSATIRAVMLDPKSPDALAALGWHLLRHNYDWAGAENAFREALQVENRHANALHWYSHLLSWQGKQDDAIAAAELAVAADPRSTLMQTNLNYILLDARRWDDASAVATRILQQDNYASLLGNSWIGYLRAGRGAQAAVMLESWAAKTGRDRRAAARVSALIVRALSADVQEDEPVPLDEELIENLQIRSEVPEIFAALGDAERTLNALEEANRTGVGYRSLLSMRINPSYDFIRDDPRFQALLDEVGLGN
jgi:hypothetical protein